MNSGKYKRLQQWGAIIQMLAATRTLDPVAKLLIELANDRNLQRVFEVINLLDQAPEPLTTLKISEKIGVGIENTRQLIRALKEGGLEIKTDVSTSNYHSFKISPNSVLIYLIEIFGQKASKKIRRIP
jgi:DNA-binding transcriptional ArsR family regulator